MPETIRISVNETIAALPAGTTVATALSALCPEVSALAAMAGGRVLELSHQLQTDASLLPLTYQHEEGRRLYERSLRFLFVSIPKDPKNSKKKLHFILDIWVSPC